MIPQQAIEEVKARNDIVDVVSSYVNLTKRTGSNMFGLCPFHREKSPSFSVSPSKQIFHCFGCQKGGDVITFMMEIEKLGYVDAIRKLAERIGYDLPETTDPRERERAQSRKRLIELSKEAARFYYLALQSPKGRACREYLDARKLSVAVQRQFGLGYAPDDWQGLWDHLQSKGYSVDECERSGLFKKNRNGGYYDLFRGRLMFPIIDVTNQVIAFGGRVLDDSSPKYINSPETEIYTKGRHTFGLNIAKKSKSESFIVVEGYMDVIALHQGGIDEAVACLGTALTPEQVQLLKRYKEQLILSLDSDAAGQEATRRSLDIVRDKGAEARVLMIPDAKDPDQYVKDHGAERFRALIHDALNRVDYLLSLAKLQASKPDGEIDPIRYQKNAIEVLADIENTVVQELYLSRVAETLGVGIDAIRIELAKEKQKPKRGNPYANVRVPQTGQTPDHAPAYGEAPQEDGMDVAYPEPEPLPVLYLTREELYLLVLLANRPEDYPVIREAIQSAWFRGEEGKRFAQLIFEWAEEEQLSLTKLIEVGQNYTMNDRLLRDYIVNLSMKLPDHLPEEERHSMLIGLCLKVRIDHLKDQRQRIALQMSQTGMDEAQEKALRAQFSKVSEALEQAQREAQARNN